MRQIELSEVSELVTIKHSIEVSEFAAGQIEFFDVHCCVSSQSLFENFVGQSTSKSLFCFYAFGVLDAETI